MKNFYFVVFVGLFLMALAAISLSYFRRTRRSSQATWDGLIKRLMWVDRDKVALIALDVVSESGEPRREANSFALDPSEIWGLLGGLDGLEVLEQNCQVLVELASYVQTWYPEAVVVAEQLRLNAKEIEWHVGRLKGAAKTGNLQSSFADYAQRAVVTYYLMTRHVLQLYDQADAPGLNDLQRAL